MSAAIESVEDLLESGEKAQRAKEKAAERRKTQGEEDEYKDKEADPTAEGEAQKVEES